VARVALQAVPAAGLPVVPKAVLAVVRGALNPRLVACLAAPLRRAAVPAVAVVLSPVRLCRLDHPHRVVVAPAAVGRMAPGASRMPAAAAAPSLVRREAARLVLQADAVVRRVPAGPGVQRWGFPP
jgi:hypothetical protein